MELTELDSVDDVPVLRVHGDIDLRTVDAFRAAAQQPLSQRPELLVVDLSGVTFLDSSGLKVLDDIQRRADDHQGRVALVVPDPRLLRLLEITGLDARFPIHPTPAEAIAEDAEDE